MRHNKGKRSYENVRKRAIKLAKKEKTDMVIVRNTRSTANVFEFAKRIDWPAIKKIEPKYALFDVIEYEKIKDN